MGMQKGLDWSRLFFRSGKPSHYMESENCRILTCPASSLTFLCYTGNKLSSEVYCDVYATLMKDSEDSKGFMLYDEEKYKGWIEMARRELDKLKGDGGIVTEKTNRTKQITKKQCLDSLVYGLVRAQRLQVGLGIVV